MEKKPRIKPRRAAGFKEDRVEPRQAADFPLKLDSGISATLRDVSASGLSFETTSVQRVGDVVNIEIDLDTPGGPMKIKAQGQIVRIETHGDRTGVGVKLLSSRLEAVNS